MPSLLDRWLESEKQPAHLYELLGLPPFSGQDGEAAQRIRTLSRELLALQNSSDPKVSSQVLRLQSLLGQADRVFRTSEARLKYEDQLLDQWLGRRDDLTSLTSQQAVKQRLMQVDQLTAEDAHRIAGRVLDKLRQSGSGANGLQAAARHRVFGASNEGSAAGLAPTAAYTPPPRDSAGPVAVETSTSSRVATASSVRAAPAPSVPGPPKTDSSEILLELETAPKPWAQISTTSLAIIFAIGALCILNIAVLIARYSRTTAEVDAPIIVTQPAAANTSSAPGPAPAIPKPSPPATMVTPPATTSVTPPPASPSTAKSPTSSSAAWQPGSRIDVTGRLLEVQGRFVQDTPELHLHIECENAPVKAIAAFSKDSGFPAAVLDYLSAQEDSELTGVSPGKGDRVRVQGEVVGPGDASLRIPAAAGATLVRLASVERVGDSMSKIEVGTTVRDSTTLRGNLLDLTLRGLLRLPPNAGETFHFRGKYQEVVAPEKTWLFSFGGRLRGLELLVPEATAPTMSPNEEVEITGTSQGLIATRVVGNVLVVRPVLQAVSVRSAKSATPIISEPKSASEPTSTAIPASTPPPAAPAAVAQTTSSTTPNSAEPKPTPSGTPLKDRLAVDPFGPGKPFTVIAGMPRTTVQNRLGVSPLSVPFKTGEAARRADAYLGEGSKGNTQLSVFVYNSQDRVIYLESKSLPAGSQLNAAAQVVQEILESFANSTAALVP